MWLVEWCITERVDTNMRVHARTSFPTHACTHAHTHTRTHACTHKSMDELQEYVLMQHSEALTPILQSLNLLGTHRKPPPPPRPGGGGGGELSTNLLC